MWLCLNNAFLSAVAVAGDPSKLCVRARRKGDLERTFAGCVVLEDGVDPAFVGRDYSFRTYLPREVVAGAIAGRLEDIDYTNFKGSVRDPKLHDAYYDVWTAMSKLQARRPYGRPVPDVRKPAPRKRATKSVRETMASAPLPRGKAGAL